jgi:hypothetical protein
MQGTWHSGDSMMTLNLNTDIFPKLRDGVRASWAPIFFEPISGSTERFVVGVAAVGDDGFHLEWANRLSRLQCFYGADANGAINALKLGRQYLENDLSERAVEALSKPAPAVTGLAFGDVKEAAGFSYKSIAETWLASLSSLYVRQMASNTNLEELKLEASTVLGRVSKDRLPFLVCDYVKAKHRNYENYFNQNIQDGKERRRRGVSHQTMIDFTGMKLVANFGTLKASAISTSVNLIKQRLWDLKVERDKVPTLLGARDHEMIVQRPVKDDPQVTEKQQSYLDDAIEALESQADQEELRFRPLTSVKEIGDHLMAIESAIAA